MNRRLHAGHGRSAFTLLELLVAVAIIAVLAMLLMGMIRRGRDNGDAAQCINNIRQLAQANLRYATENGGQFCYAMDKPNKRRWHGERRDVDESFDPTRGPLAPYLGREARVKICPTFQNVLKGGDSFEDGSGGYGYNAIYIGGSPRNKWEGERVSNVERPTQTIMFTDSGLARANGIQEYPFAEPWNWVTSDGRLAGELTPSVHFRHHGLAHVAWCDGHVTAEKPSVIKDGNYYNGDNHKYHVGWFGPAEENGYWNPRRESVK
jgi:prepilin-type N-terminal cleavage/methylation domain-containing protein/prepilin-type processing-associated H-X9-DG protein